MIGKLRIIILAVLAVASFGVSYLATEWLGGEGEAATGPAAAVGSPFATETHQAQGGPVQAASLMTAQPATLAMKERGLDTLIRELRQKMEDYKTKRKELEKREKRIEMAGESLKKQAKEVETLQAQLDAPLIRLRKAKAELEDAQVRVWQQEKANLKRTAGIYDKMDAVSSSEILADMCKNNQEDDAAKILRYMSERSAAKLLASMPDRAAAAKLCQRLKSIQEDG